MSHCIVHRLVPLAAATLAVILASACSDSTGPEPGVGYYRLETVNGRPLSDLPRRSRSAISHGDLLLRDDGSFAIGTSGRIAGLGFFMSGTWRLADVTLHLTVPPWEAGGHTREMSATLDADSVVLVLEWMVPDVGIVAPYAYVFRRAPRSRQPVSPGVYVMTSLDGREDLTAEWTEWEQTEWERRVVHRVLYDSITFLDQAFFRRHRAERTVWYLAPGDSNPGYTEWTTHGSYEGRDGALVLRDFFSAEDLLAADTLAVGQGTLIRRSPSFLPPTYEPYVKEEVYSRR